MSSPYDFNEARQGWREDEARLGHDNEGDRLAAIAEERFLRETYCDEDPECTCRLAGDQADASDCDAHSGRLLSAPSWYNHGQMSLFDEPALQPGRKPSEAAVLLSSVDDLLLDEGVA